MSNVLQLLPLLHSIVRKLENKLEQEDSQTSRSVFSGVKHDWEVNTSFIHLFHVSSHHMRQFYSWSNLHYHTTKYLYSLTSCHLDKMLGSKCWKKSEHEIYHNSWSISFGVKHTGVFTVHLFIASLMFWDLIASESFTNEQVHSSTN